jgi:asparagine synthase (glutamine-hydrolysing)
MAARGSAKVRTFTITLPGHGSLDETHHARLIARHFATEHTELEAKPVTADLLPALARQFDEPMVDSSMIPTYLVSKLVREHCTVALGGDGGDELFGGYGGYSSLQRMRNSLGRIPLSMRRGISAIAEHVLPVGLMGRNWLQALGADLERSLPLNAPYFDATTRRKLVRWSSSWRAVAEDVMRERVPAEADLVQRATRMDFENYLPDDILVKVDRASMLNSLEVRAPFLDYHVIEFAFGKVPSHLKATPWEKKVLPKRLTTRLLPPAFDRDRKQGFSIPLAAWLRDGAFRDMFNSVLRDPACPFDSRCTDRLLCGQDRGRSNSERLFALVMFELWRREYAVSL